MTQSDPAGSSRSDGLLRMLAWLFIAGLSVGYGAALASLWGVGSGGLLRWALAGSFLSLAALVVGMFAGGTGSGTR